MTDDKKELPERMVARFHEREAMAELILNLADHDWGFWTREEQRFHIQTVETGAQKGPNAVKFWLERRGVRTFQLAYGDVNAAEVSERVRAEWDFLEAKWISLMVERGWVRAYLKDGDKIIVQAYPDNKGATFVRTINLREVLAGHFSPHVRETTPITPKDIVINKRLNAVEIWPDLPSSDRHHFPLSEFLFEGRP